MVFLFNTVGYKALFYVQLRNADFRLEKKIQIADYLEGNLISIKIPLKLPYLADWSGFQAVEGEMIYKQKTYKYIKKKIARDTLFLICIDHSEKDEIEKNTNNFLSKTSGENASKKAFSKPIKYDFNEKSICCLTIIGVSIRTAPALSASPAMQEGFLQTILNPPDYLV